MALLNLTAISCLILLTFTLNSGIAQAAIPTQYPANISIPVYCKNDHQFYCWETDDCRPANTRCDGIENCPKGEDELNCPACTADNAEDFDKFFCTPENTCIPRMWRCDGTPDCNTTALHSADEVDCDTSTATCKDDDFVCGDNKCIPTEWKCDEQTDCDDGSDETEALCKGTCAPSEFLCPAHNGTASRCIATTWKCDGEPDCAGGEDELGCGKRECPTGTFNCTGENVCLTTAWLCDGDDDCSSGDDEAHCDPTASPSQNTCTDFEFACKSGECILSSWMCDSDPDCLDGSDEEECDPKKTECDDTSEFYCTADDRCIPSFLTCSGQSECSDGEDEKLSRCTLPEDELRHCDLNKNEFPCESQIYKTKCVDFSLTCDGKQDCTSGRDENPEFCSGDNIEDQCVGQPCGSDSLVQCKNVISNYTDTNNNPSSRTLGTTCHCPHGYEYNSHNKECIDIDECKNQEMPVCDQLCLNEQGSYRCACQEGYQLSADGRSCKVTGSVHPKLLFTNRHAIRSMHIHTGNHAEYMPLMNSKAAVALDFDYVAGEVYYSDIDEKKLFKFSLPTADQEEEVKKVDLRIPGVQVPDGLAYDWIYKHLYWTDTSSNSINMACIDDDVTTGDVAPRRVMMLYNNTNPDCAKLPANSTSMEVCIDEPRALVVHPHKGWVFWSDWGNKAHIAFGHLDGSHKEMIAYNTDDNKHYLGWPNGLTLDTSGNNEKLYWIDAKLHSIFSCSVDHCLGDIQALTYDHDKIIHPYSITVFENHLYWSDWHHQWITMANKYTGGNMTSVITNIRQPMDLKVFHPMAQQNGTNHCKDDEGNALCSQLCFPKPWTKDSRTSTFVRVPDAEKQYTCKCAEEYTLQADGRSCSLTNPTHIPRTDDGGDDSNIETGTASKHTGEEDSGSMNLGTVAAIAASAVFLIGVAIAVAAVVGVRRHRMQKNKNMNFDNPIYKRTTEDKLELPRHEYQPSQTEPSAMVPLTSSEGASTSDNLDV